MNPLHILTEILPVFLEPKTTVTPVFINPSAVWHFIFTFAIPTTLFQLLYIFSAHTFAHNQCKPDISVRFHAASSTISATTLS